MKIHHENLSNHVIFDIETAGTASEELVRAINPPYPDFDPSGVKTGDCRNPEAAAEKIEKAREAHAEQETNHWSGKMEKRALQAETGRVLTIGYLRASEPDESAIIDDGGGDESLLIHRFWNGFERLRKERGHLVGWNSGGGMSVGFDLGFIIKRSWILGIPVPVTVMKGRFVSDVFVDLMQVWGLFQFKSFAKLDHCARVLGVGNKTDQACTGGQFAEWYRDASLKEQAIDYAKLDLILTREIYLKLMGQPSLA